MSSRRQAFGCRLRGALRAVLAIAALGWSAAGWSAVDLRTATIADVQADFADGSLTSEQLLKAYLARIET